jgi:excisionase family DNA binding protein
VAKGLDKPVLTTGEVAQICHVAPRTVSKWFDSGKLRGYRIPGSRDRRIPADQLIAFMRAHDIPLDTLEGGLCRILLVDEHVDPGLLDELRSSGRFDVQTAADGFQAGMAAQQSHPHVMVLNGDSGEDAAAICRNIRGSSALQSTRVAVSLAEADQRRDELLAAGFDAVLGRPYSVRALAQVIAELTDLTG